MVEYATICAQDALRMRNCFSNIYILLSLMHVRGAVLAEYRVLVIESPEVIRLALRLLSNPS
jgi:hypothetical protein